MPHQGGFAKLAKATRAQALVYSPEGMCPSQGHAGIIIVKGY
jgi:hypothetical protein